MSPGERRAGALLRTWYQLITSRFYKKQRAFFLLQRKRKKEAGRLKKAMKAMKRHKKAMKAMKKQVASMKKAMKATKKQVASMKKTMADMERRMAWMERQTTSVTPPQQELFSIFLWHVQRPHPDATIMMVDPSWSIAHVKALIRIQEGYADEEQMLLISDNHENMQDDMTLAAYDIISDDIIRVDVRPQP
jgi:seryl-tRNA synthetase